MFENYFASLYLRYEEIYSYGFPCGPLKECGNDDDAIHLSLFIHRFHWYMGSGPSIDPQCCWFLYVCLFVCLFVVFFCVIVHSI